MNTGASKKKIKQTLTQSLTRIQVNAHRKIALRITTPYCPRLSAIPSRHAITALPVEPFTPPALVSCNPA